MQAGTPFGPDLLLYGHIKPYTAEQRRCSFESPGGSSTLNLVPNATPTPQTGSLSLADEQISAVRSNLTLNKSLNLSNQITQVVQVVLTMLSSLAYSFEPLYIRLNPCLDMTCN